MSSKKGFTLVELLVVISIIALLVSILLPGLNRARAQAKRVVCASYLHSWGLALMTYSMDNEDYFPYNGPAIPPAVPIGTYSLNWCGSTVQEFMKNYLIKSDSDIKSGETNIVWCPTLTHAGIDQATIDAGMMGYFLLPHSFNVMPAVWDYTADGRNPDGWGWRTRKKFGSRYSDGVVAADMLIEYVELDSWYGAHKNSGKQKPDGGNLLFEDGRVDWINIDEMGVGLIYTGVDAVIWDWYNPIKLTF